MNTEKFLNRKTINNEPWLVSDENAFPWSQVTNLRRFDDSSGNYTVIHTDNVDLSVKEDVYTILNTMHMPLATFHPVRNALTLTAPVI